MKTVQMYGYAVSHSVMLRLMAVAMFVTGCAGMQASATVGTTQVALKGYTTNPEQATYALGAFVQQTTDAQTRQTLVLEGKMPYMPDGCYGNRCWRMRDEAAAGPLPTRAQKAREQAAVSSGKNGRAATPENGSNAELEAARKEAAQAKKERDEALDALSETVKEADSKK